MKPALLLLLAVAAFGQSRQSPGTLNPAVSQANIRTTICVPGWTSTIRPPARYTNEQKAKQMAERRLKGKPSAFEEDHVTPLELGGDPRDPANLQPQPWPEAHRKDAVERWLHRQVCRVDGKAMPLAEAQRMVLDWQNPEIWKMARKRLSR